MESTRRRLQQRLGYQFRQPDLLAMALRHESFAQESAEGSQERLEFLGDSVVGLVVSEFLYRAYPDFAEGRLAQMKASLVSTEQLADKARDLELGECVELGRGEQSRQRANLLADTLEAVLGAIYLESGFETVRQVLLGLFSEELDAAGELRRDFKSLLQEVTQREFQELPEYAVLEELGPPHDRTFGVQVSVQGAVLGQGQGRSKREASQKAAEEALSRLEGAHGEQGEEPTRTPPDED